ncbi:MAG: hypothetical protein ACTSR5_09200 [Promethearchaeota archaeon]
MRTFAIFSLKRLNTGVFSTMGSIRANFWTPARGTKKLDLP